MRCARDRKFRDLPCLLAIVLLLFSGSGNAADIEDLLRQAELGDANAQFDLGTAYLSGTDTTKDEAQALVWLNKAARAGHPEAQFALGEMYAGGRGVVEDRVEAYFWYNISARNGSVAAAKRRDAIGGELTSSEFFGIQARVREWSKRRSVPSPGTAQPTGSRPASTSTGFVVSPQGVTLTSAHSVRGCRSMTVQGGATGKAFLLAVDSDLDLALLSIEGASIDHAPFRPGAAPRLGTEVVVFGYPLQGVLAYGANVTAGIISGLAGPRNDGRVIQHTAPVQPGNSGAPLLDRQGRVIGVVVSKLNAWQTARRIGDIPQAINFAVRPGHVRSFLESNGIAPKTIASQAPASIADVAERAGRFTVLLECWR